MGVISVIIVSLPITFVVIFKTKKILIVYGVLLLLYNCAYNMFNYKQIDKLRKYL